MNYKDLTIKKSYINQGPGNFADAFLVPSLKCTKRYERSVGYFSSGVFESILDGIMGLVKNRGHIHLIASPHLSQEDIDAINAGYKKRDIINGAATRDLIEEVERLDSVQLQMLADLIAENILDVKIAVSESDGDYHDKLGVLTDVDGNTIAFFGSPNESNNGYRKNYEKIRIARSWIPYEADAVEDEKNEFAALWNHENKYVTTYDFKDSLKKHILEVMERRSKASYKPVELRDYQEEAIKAWVNNGYHGFFTMATGTGKTFTAIYATKELQKEHPSIIVICAPYKHLIKQWAEDIEKVYPDATMIMVSSENPGWDLKISNAIIAQKYDPSKLLIIISTIVSFSMERFDTAIQKASADKLLVVDEAHRFTNRPEWLKDRYQYMLGLSATPYSGMSAARGRELMDFFGGQVYSLPIETALKKGHLVPYYYHPIFVHATEDEERRFGIQTQIIVSCFKNGVLIDPDKLVKALRNRLRIISMANEKQSKIDYILDSVKERDHLVVYCGDGKLYNDMGEAIRHISEVKRILSEHGFKPSQFTCTENMAERMELVKLFNNQNIDALAAIRCLDEGINIPSIKAALILSSNDDYREFVQRRGRILRKYDGKTSANIYDVVVLPSLDNQAWAKIEFRRFREYAKLATNGNEMLEMLDGLLDDYHIAPEEVDVYDYDEMGDEVDE